MVTCPHCRCEFEPLELNGPKPKGRTSMTFSKWIESLNGAEAIPDGHHALRYARTAHIPDDFVALAWSAFEARYSNGAHARKVYKDWPGAFRDHLEGNFLRLWWIDDAGHYQLTTAGKQLKRALGEEYGCTAKEG